MPLCLRKVLKLPFPVASDDLAAPAGDESASILAAFGVGPAPHPLDEARLELTDLVAWTGDVKRALSAVRVAPNALSAADRRSADLAIGQLIAAERALAAALGAISLPKAPPSPDSIAPFPGAA